MTFNAAFPCPRWHLNFYLIVFCIAQFYTRTAYFQFITVQLLPYQAPRSRQHTAGWYGQM